MWSKAKLFKIPGVRDAAIAWVVRTGVVESGYRQDEVFFLPKLKRRDMKWQRFIAKYFQAAKIPGAAAC